MNNQYADFIDFLYLHIFTNICKLLPQVHSRYCIYLCVCLVMKKSSFSIGIFGDIWYAATGVVVVVMQGSNYARKSEEVVNTIRIEKFNPPHFLLLDGGLLTQSVSFFARIM